MAWCKVLLVLIFREQHNPKYMAMIVSNMLFEMNLLIFYEMEKHICLCCIFQNVAGI